MFVYTPTSESFARSLESPVRPVLSNESTTDVYHCAQPAFDMNSSDEYLDHDFEDIIEEGSSTSDDEPSFTGLSRPPSNNMSRYKMRLTGTPRYSQSESIFGVPREDSYSNNYSSDGIEKNIKDIEKKIALQRLRSAADDTLDDHAHYLKNSLVKTVSKNLTKRERELLSKDLEKQSSRLRSFKSKKQQSQMGQTNAEIAPSYAMNSIFKKINSLTPLQRAALEDDIRREQRQLKKTHSQISGLTSSTRR